LSELREKRDQSYKKAMDEATAILMPSQRADFEKMLGAKFDFSAKVPSLYLTPSLF